MDILRRLDPAVEKHWLLLLAGCLWTAVGVMLNVLAFGWLGAAEWGTAVPLALAGLVGAVVVYRFGFLRLAHRNIARIAAAEDRVCVFAFQAWRSYVIIAVMMALGVVLRLSAIPKPDLAVLYMGIGGGLFLSSLHYYRRLLVALGNKATRPPALGVR